MPGLGAVSAGRVSLLVAAAISGACGADTSVPDDDLALGPAPRATVFAPGVVSTEDHDDLNAALAPHGREVYFVRRASGGPFTIHVSRRLRDGGWSESEVAPFSGEFDDHQPFITADGERLYFTSNRPAASGGDPIAGRDVWMVEAVAGGWSEPRRVEGERLRIEPPGGEELSRFWGLARGPVEGPDRALYFWAERPGSLGGTDLYRAAPAEGGFAEPVNLGPPLNSPGYETGLAVAPDGAAIVFTRDGAPDGHGLGDLYVSIRDGDGWGEPRNLGPLVNTEAYDYAPRFSPDGRYLFFSSNRDPGADGPGDHDVYYIEVEALGLDGAGSI
ncbi:MAG: hypothetical protein ACODAE_04405 [Gemmatimonadota bacterium]